MTKRVRGGLAGVICGTAIFCSATGCTGPLVYRPEKKGPPVTAAQGALMTKHGTQEKYKLPPQPDWKANSATVAGIDSTGAGVRDDVHLWIYASYTSTAKRTILMAMAKSLQELLVKPPTTVQEAEKIKVSHDAALLALKALPGLNPGESEEMDDRMNMLVTDTPGRLRAYLQYDLLLGKNSSSPAASAHQPPPLLPPEAKGGH